MVGNVPKRATTEQILGHRFGELDGRFADMEQAANARHERKGGDPSRGENQSRSDAALVPSPV